MAYLLLLLLFLETEMWWRASAKQAKYYAPGAIFNCTKANHYRIPWKQLYFMFQLSDRVPKIRPLFTD